MNKTTDANHLLLALVQFMYLGTKKIIDLFKIVIKKILPSQFIYLLREADLFDRYSTKSYSQYGEDMVLKSVFQNQERGFYVDVGAHHPKLCSNTYFFYKLGWSGINIDAMPGGMELFKNFRSRDINLETAIARNKQELTYFMFAEPLFNSFDRELSHQRHNDGNSKIVNEQRIVTKTLAEILTEHLPSNQKINFLSIDVEGLDLEVLYSNNWQIFRPEYILIECFYWDIDKVKDDKIYRFLTEKEYVFFAKTIYTVIFVAKELVEKHRQQGIFA